MYMANIHGKKKNATGITLLVISITLVGILLTLLTINIPPILIYSYSWENNKLLEVTVRDDFFGPATDVYIRIDPTNEFKNNITKIEFLEPRPILENRTTAEQRLYYIPHLYRPDEVKFRITFAVEQNKTRGMQLIDGGSDKVKLIDETQVNTDYIALKAALTPFYELWDDTHPHRKWFYDNPIAIIVSVAIILLFFILRKVGIITKKVGNNRVQERILEVFYDKLYHTLMVYYAFNS